MAQSTAGKVALSWTAMASLFGLFCLAPLLVPVLVFTAPVAAPVLIRLGARFPALGRVGGAIAWVGVLQVAAVAGTFLLPWWFVGLVLLIGGLGASFTRLIGRVEVLALVIGPIGALLGALAAQPLVEVLQGTHHGGSITSVPAHAEARVFRFYDAVFRHDLGSAAFEKWSSSKNRSAGQRYDWVVPLVPVTWTVTEPVPAWAVCSNSKSPCPDWQGPPTEAVRVLQLRSGTYAALVAEAEQTHRLRSAPGAPRLEIIEAFDAWLNERIAMSVFLCGGLMFLSILTAPVTAHGGAWTPMR